MAFSLQFRKMNRQRKKPGSREINATFLSPSQKNLLEERFKGVKASGKEECKNVTKALSFCSTDWTDMRIHSYLGERKA